MNKLILFIGFVCIFTSFIVEAADRKSVEKCLIYSKDEIVYDDPNTKKCNLPVIKDVQDGTKATPKQFPHIAILGYLREDSKILQWSCMGSLISENFILTAAHCVAIKNSRTPSKVRLGDFSLNPNSIQSQELEIADIIKHPEYDVKSHRNDIALIKLKEAAKLNTFVRPACLFTKLDISEKKGLYSGRKYESSHDVKKTTLLQVLAEIQPDSKCKEVYSEGFLDDGSQLCASARRESTDNCLGESGSALVFESAVPCMFEIVGFVTRGKACGQVENPEIYTKVPYYLDWIEKTVWP